MKNRQIVRTYFGSNTGYWELEGITKRTISLLYTNKYPKNSEVRVVVLGIRTTHRHIIQMNGECMHIPVTSSYVLMH